MSARQWEMCQLLASNESRGTKSSQALSTLRHFTLDEIVSHSDGKLMMTKSGTK